MGQIDCVFCLVPSGGTLVTRIVEVLRIAVTDGKFFHVMVPLADNVVFMNTNMVQIRVLMCQV